MRNCIVLDKLLKDFIVNIVVRKLLDLFFKSDRLVSILYIILEVDKWSLSFGVFVFKWRRGGEDCYIF